MPEDAASGRMAPRRRKAWCKANALLATPQLPILSAQPAGVRY
jgi:hypothetical protein